MKRRQRTAMCPSSKPGRLSHTFSQRPVVRLNVEVDLGHLTPPARPEDAQNISKIVLPSVSMNRPRHHSAVNQIKMVGGKRGPSIRLAIVYQQQGAGLTVD